MAGVGGFPPVAQRPRYARTPHRSVPPIGGFPRLRRLKCAKSSFQDDFAWWAQQGQELLDLHIGFETAEPWPLERADKDGVTPVRAILRADKDRSVITLDEQTTLAGVPTEAWEYRLGNRSALEWVLDQYKERKPRDPTIRERFNTYRFADHKEHVIDLLGRVCAVSAFTTTIVEELDTRSSIERT